MMAASSKSIPFMPLILCLLLALVPTRAQDDEDQWFWIMADSKNSTVACPGRCLAVNDTGTADYTNKPVVFVACKSDDSSESSGSSPTSNNQQRWIRAPNSKQPNNTNATIQFNATAATGGPGNANDLLCLQPDPANSNLTLKIASCTGHRNQQWIIANNTIASLAHDTPHYLAMSYNLTGFLNASDGPLGWRQATILPTSRPPNNSLTTTFSMVDGTMELTPPTPIPNTEPNQTHNFITNPQFEQTSYDFPNETANLTINPSDPFSLCDWQVMKGSATLAPNPERRNPNRALSNQTLLLKDAVVRQNIATSPGAFYTLMLKVAIAPPDTSTTDQSTDCNGNDTLSVNPYPSTNVHLDVEVNNRSWTTQHVSFQAGGNILQLAFQGCASCGCYLDDLYLMQVIDSSPFPPPPLRPTPPIGPGSVPPEPKRQFPPGRNSLDEGLESHRLPNGTVVGIVVGTAALFLVIGAACFWVVVGHKKEMGKGSEVGMGRPREWSIQTTSAAQSQPGARGNSSTTVPIHHSASATFGGGGATVISASSRTTTTTTSPSLSSSNPLSERGA